MVHSIQAIISKKTFSRDQAVQTLMNCLLLFTVCHSSLEVPSPQRDNGILFGSTILGLYVISFYPISFIDVP